MNANLYKTIFHFDVPICDGQLAENPHTGEMQTAQQWLTWTKERDVRQWLSANGHAAPVMVYHNCDPQWETGEIVVVLNDRDTAIMLKLALA